MIIFRKAFAALKARFSLPSAPAVQQAPEQLPAPVEAAPPPAAEPVAPAQHHLVLCVPGAWVDAGDFTARVAALRGHYSDAGRLSVDLDDIADIELDIVAADPRLAVAFRIASQGKMDEGTLKEIGRHTAVAYLRFPAALDAQANRLLKFCRFMERAGGLGVKVETSGVAHGWAHWANLLKGGLPGQYAAGVTLVTSADFYHSCGMHNFGLPDCEVPGTLEFDVAINLINQFNFWRLSALPVLSSGHSFSLGKGAPGYTLNEQSDERHAPDSPLCNPHGLWRLDLA